MQLHRLSLPWLAGAAAILATAMPVAAYASEAAKAIDPATLPVETFFSHAKFGGALISPNGEQLAVLTPVGERIGLSVINLKTHDAKVVAADPDWDVARVNWINDKRLAFGIRDTKAVMAEAGSSALYAVNSDGSLLRRLDLETNATGGKSLSWRRGVSLFETLQDGSNDVLVISNERGGGKDDEIGGTDVYRMDTLTGRKKILTFENPGHVVEWVVDNARVVRAAVSWVNDPSDAKLHIRSYYRDSEADKWHVINDAAFDAPTVVPIGFDADNKTMYVSARADKDTTGIYKWDFAKNALGELALRHPRADADSLIHDFKTDRVVGVAVDAMKPETYYFDEDYARLQATIDSALPDTVNVVRNRGDHALVVSYSDVNPGDVYLYTDKTHSLEPVLSYKPNFPVAAMSAMQVVEYKARDGLPIPAYLTTPKTKPAKQLPLVVFVHGGPHARDNWGFDPFVQHLASRGYAVL
jgi:dipeptidyl aminopeptidase/acylaminoacyl peptidase